MRKIRYWYLFYDVGYARYTYTNICVSNSNRKEILCYAWKNQFKFILDLARNFEAYIIAKIVESLLNFVYHQSKRVAQPFGAQ